MEVYNTLGRRKEEFSPLRKGEVRMYVCGVTLYDECHLGHGRAYVVFDVIRRYLEFKGYKVRYVQNFTDIDDKIIQRAREEAKKEEEVIGKCREIAERYKVSYFEVMDKLGVKRADIYPCATEHIPEMIRIIEGLFKKGHAYNSGGDIYFSVDSFPSYGKLSGRKKEDLLPGARVEKDERKRNPLDFVLWKSRRRGEPFWDSPWGEGRPGWHIECSAMSMEYLGETLDIHGGGEDLIFPHHENEIAQSEGYTGKPFVRYWLHNAFVKVKGEKMSKSLKNYFLLRELLSQYSPEVLRLFLISTHYRKPLDFALSKLESYQRAWRRIEEAFLNAEKFLGNVSLPSQEPTSYWKRFEEVMDEDFQTPEALCTIFSLISELNKRIARGEKDSKSYLLFQELKEMLSVLGFTLPCQFQLSPYLLNLVKEREEARKRKDWEKADRIREILLKEGIILQDTPQGTVWRRKV